MEFTDRIDDLLLRINEKRSHLAEKIGIANQSFTDWKKRGTIPSADIALKIAKYFNVSVEYLLTGKDTDGISPEEIEFMRKYKSLEPHNRNAVNVLLKGLYEQGKGKV